MSVLRALSFVVAHFMRWRTGKSKLDLICERAVREELFGRD